MPSAASIAEAMARHESAKQAAYLNSVTINGVSYAACVRLGALELRPHHEGGGSIRYQKIEVWIPKTALPTRPAVNSHITCQDSTYEIPIVHGDNPQDAAWHLIGNLWVT